MKLVIFNLCFGLGCIDFLDSGLKWVRVLKLKWILIIIKDRTVLKEHMRKKQHKKINPNNRQYDKFYVVNYLEPGKNWQDIMNEFDEQVNTVLFFTKL